MSTITNVQSIDINPHAVSDEENHVEECPAEDRTQQASARGLQSIATFFGSALNGSTLRGKVTRAVAVGGLAALAAFLISNPAGWAITAAGVAACAIYLLGQFAIPTARDCMKHGVSPKQMVEFKISAWQRLSGMRGNNCDLVFTHPTSGKKLYLSALPNKDDPQFKQKIEHGEIGAVFSVNESWEVSDKIGVSNPYTEAEYAHFGVKYTRYEFQDHGLISEDLLNQAAHDIATALEGGKDCLVHCRAGVGRSSQLIAAYLIRYQNMSAKEAAESIKQGRPQATIQKKLDNKTDKHGNVVSYGISHYASRNRNKGREDAAATTRE